MLLLAPAARAQATVFRFQFQLTGSTPLQG